MRPAPRPNSPKIDAAPAPVVESAVRWGSAKPQGSTQPVKMAGELADLVAPKKGFRMPVISCLIGASSAELLDDLRGDR